MLLQSVLTGRAREIYTELTVEAASNYDNVKHLILKGYELVPEAYRQKFRNWERGRNQTYVEFARAKEQLFDRWCHSKNIEKDYGNLRQLILLEEFKRCINADVKTFLDEKSPETLDIAAQLADDYSLTHKMSLAGKPTQAFTNKGVNQYSQKRFRVQPPSTQGRTDKSTDAPSSAVAQSESKKDQPFPRKVCSHCKRPGHLVSDCYQLHGRPKSKPSGFV